jgi:hypothetical protein
MASEKDYDIEEIKIYLVFGNDVKKELNSSCLSDETIRKIYVDVDKYNLINSNL